jgi:2-alkenal reductase
MKHIKPLLQHSATLLLGFVLAINTLPYFLPDTAFAGDTFTPLGQQSSLLTEQERIFEQVYDLVAPSVVSINVGVRLEGELLFIPVSSGSGFTYDTNGHIVTNAHVLTVPAETSELLKLDGTEEIRIGVSLYDGTIAEATIIGIDGDSDLAVIRVDVPPERLRPTVLGDSNQLRVGQTVLAIGNPFSNDWTLTSGIVSALNRSIVGLEGFSIGGVIQSDTAINPGNSGGPLLNINGQVVGVNSQINTESGSNTGIGFAIPSNLVSKVVQALIRDGAIEYSFIGIISRPVDLDLMNAFNLPNNLRGVAVLRLFSNTAPAAQAGLRPLTGEGVDVITAINNQPIADFDELIAYLALNTNPNDSVTLTVYRNGEILNMPVTLTQRPNQ